MLYQPNLRATRCFSLLLAVALLAPAGSAQLYVYALNSQGKVNVNGVQIDQLSGGLKFNDINNVDDIKPDAKIWNSMAVDGASWWSLRTDGKLNDSGVQTGNFNFNSIFEALWIDVTILGGSQWSLRTDGKLNVDGMSPVTFGDSSYFFTRITNDGENVWTLRSDGYVFKNTETPALFRFNGSNQFGENDGDSIVTEWIGITVDPATGDLYGLRRDGEVGAADPDDYRGGAEGGPPSAPVVATLPFPGDEDNVDAGNIYLVLEFLDDGSWLVLRGNGEVFAEADTANALVDLPGSPSDFEDNSFYVWLMTFEDGFISIRQDGKLYVGTDTTEVLDLPGDSYRQLACGTTLPDLSNVKTKPPVVTKYTVKAVTGEGFVLPVLVSDVDTPISSVAVTADMTTVPPGAVWNEDALTLTWDSPGPAGKYAFKVTADDGMNKPVNRTFKISVKDPKANAAKNAKPVAAKVKKATALDNAPYALPLLISDPDMDEVAVSVDDSVYPYTAGATFDAMTNTFMWTPTLQDVGKVKLQFSLTDGTVTKKYKVKLKVVASLVTFP